MTDTAKKTAKKTVAPALDFASLTVTEAAAPTREGSVTPAENPAYAWVKDSWANKTAVGNSQGQPVYRGAGRQVIVPTANAGQVESLIRKAAAALSRELDERIGTAVVKEELTGKDRGKTAVRFCAKTGKRPYTKNGNGDNNG